MLQQQGTVVRLLEKTAVKHRALAVAVAVLVVGIGTAAGAASPGTPAASAGGVELFVGAPDEHRLTPLDPATLANLPGRAAVDFGPGEGFRDVAMSADGSTLVTVEYPRETAVAAEDVTIVVRDGRTGAERRRFRPPVPVAFPRLSEDGGRLVAETNPNAAARDRMAFAWSVFATGDGRPTATVEPAAGWAEATIDPRAERLYAVVPSSEAQTGSGTTPPPELVAYDLATGTEAGRLTLTDLQTGYWAEDGEIDGERRFRHFRSGLAISPDGRRLVVARADREAVTLIDAATLAVERTVPLTRATSGAERLLGLLPLAPRAASAKMGEGITLRATFGPDGRHLYVFGTVEEAEGDERQWARGLGLAIVEVGTGRIVAEGLAGEVIHDLRVAPDGRTAYAVGPRGGRELVAWVGEPDGYRRTYALWRLDATTADPSAERTFSDYPLLFLRPVEAAGG
jgi:hypothetical protein